MSKAFMYRWIAHPSVFTVHSLPGCRKTTLLDPEMLPGHPVLQQCGLLSL